LLCRSREKCVSNSAILAWNFASKNACFSSKYLAFSSSFIFVSWIYSLFLRLRRDSLCSCCYRVCSCRAKLLADPVSCYKEPPESSGVSRRRRAMPNGPGPGIKDYYRFGGVVSLGRCGCRVWGSCYWELGRSYGWIAGKLLNWRLLFRSVFWSHPKGTLARSLLICYYSRSSCRSRLATFLLLLFREAICTLDF
jgi:hypothetical protein